MRKLRHVPGLAMVLLLLAPAAPAVAQDASSDDPLLQDARQYAKTYEGVLATPPEDPRLPEERTQDRR